MLTASKCTCARVERVDLLNNINLQDDVLSVSIRLNYEVYLDWLLTSKFICTAGNFLIKSSPSPREDCQTRGRQATCPLGDSLF